MPTTILRTQFEPGYLRIFVTSPDASLFDVATHICRQYIQSMSSGAQPDISTIPEALYPASAASSSATTQGRRAGKAHHESETSEAGGPKGKKQSQNTNKPFVIELFKAKSGTKIAVKEQLMQHNGGKAPMVDGKPLCMRSCGSHLGRCTNYARNKCARFYHFDASSQSPPVGVDLSDLKRFLEIEAIKAILEPTELGRKVLGL
jgi:hypothetical protein